MSIDLHEAAKPVDCHMIAPIQEESMSDISTGNLSSRYLIEGSLHASMGPPAWAAQVAGMARRGLAAYAG